MSYTKQGPFNNNTDPPLNATRLTAMDQGVADAHAAAMVNVKDYGAAGDGVADDTAEIQAAMDSVVAGAKPRRIWVPSGTYKITSELLINMQYVSLIGDGATIDATAILSGNALHLTGVGDNSWYQVKNEISGFKLIGSGYGGTNSTYGINLDRTDATGGWGPTQVMVRNFYLHGFNRGINLHSHANMTTFLHCTINANDIGIYYDGPTAVDSGERLGFISCNIMQNAQWGIYNVWGNLHLTNCSLDYSDRQVYNTEGEIWLTDCHIEGGSYATQAPFLIQGSTGALFVIGGSIIQNNLGPEQIPHYIDCTTGEAGGAVFMGCFMESLQPTSGFFATGTGKVRVFTDTILTNLQEAAKLPSAITDRASSSVSLDTNSTEIQRFTAALGAVVTITLPTSQRVVGMHFKFLRESTATGASALNISDGTSTVTSLAVQQWVEVMWDGAAWRVIGRGIL